MQEDERVPCCHKGTHGKGRRRKNDEHQMGHHQQRDRRTSHCQGNTEDKCGELFAETQGLMAMRTVISRAMMRCEDATRRSIMSTVVKTAFLYGDARTSLHVELPPKDPLSASGRYVGKLERAMYGTRDAPTRLLDMKFKESVSHPGGVSA